jgi:CRP-like cAMP-binding protein
MRFFNSFLPVCAFLFGPSGAFVIRKPTLRAFPAAIASKKLTSSTGLPGVQSNYETEFKEFLEQKDEYLEFCDKQTFRHAVTKAAVFAEEDALKVEQIVFQCSSAIEEFSDGGAVYSPGDDPKALYFVRSGEFECDFPDDMGGPKVFKEGEYFGGLALITGETSFGAKAIGEGSNSIWRIDKHVYEKVFPRLSLKRNLADKILSGTGHTAPYVEQALEFLTIKKYLNQSYVFNGTLTEESINLAAANITSKKVFMGQAVIRQGELGESLYIVKSGEFEVSHDRKTGLHLGSGKLFGEFGAIIDKERPFTVKASSNDCEVWEIPGPAVQTLMRHVKRGAYLEMFKDKYADESTWSVLKALIREEPRTLVALARSASTPKTKKVSSHSTLSGIAVGTALLALLPHWKPKVTKGFIQFFVLAVDETSHLAQLNFSNALLILVMLMGQLRFPQKTLKSRRVLFNTIAFGMFTNFIMGISNIMGTGASYLIDAWSWPGRILLGGSGLVCSLGIASLYHDVLTGPEKGRKANPFFESRKRGLIFCTLYNLSFFVQVMQIFPIFDSQTKFVSFTAPLMQACGATSGALTFAKFINNFYLSMGALYATFQYEEKIKIKTGNAILAFTGVLCLTDLYKFIIFFARGVTQDLSPFSTLFSYATGLVRKYQLHTIWFLPMIFAIIHGGITASRQKQYWPKKD